jgi:hypothetical protein
MVFDAHSSPARRQGCTVPAGEAPAAHWPWRRAPSDQGTGRARYRLIGLTSRIDEILLSFMPWSWTRRYDPGPNSVIFVP